MLVAKQSWSFESWVELSSSSASDRLVMLEPSSSISPMFSILMDDISDADSADEGCATAAAASSKNEFIASSVSLSSLNFR